MQSQTYRALSALLCYPEPALIAALDEIEAALICEPNDHAKVMALLAQLKKHDLIELQQDYVRIFDRNPGHSLHLFEHIHGEDRARGQAMVDLLEEYRAQGFDLASHELPDYVPLFLEFLSLCPPAEARRLLGDAVHVLAHVGRKLTESRSAYAGIFEVLVACSPVAPQPLVEPPVRDMDQALETFGPGLDGVEPLLKPSPGIIAPVNFYARRASGPC